MNLPERFQPHGAIGRGSQAVVWLVTDTLRGERVALKVYPPHALGAGGEERLRREVKAASLVRSEAALLPYDVHAFDGHVALSMPFHPGRTLADRVAASGRLLPADLRILADRLTRALIAAHGAGVLHRDVSPNNVLLSDDPRDAVLADFGSARPVGATAGRSALAGTLGYVAPEVLAGRRADVRSDLYGLGAVLYLAATGAAVADADGGLAAQLAGRFRPVGERAPDVPADLALLIGRLLDPDPDRRPEGAEEVAAWLRDGPPDAPAAPRSAGELQFLPAGRCAVVVQERDPDRRSGGGRFAPARSPAGDDATRWGRYMADRLRKELGVNAAGPPPPEDRLVAAVAAEAALPEATLRPSPVLWRPRFRLVSAVDRSCAERLAEAARRAGFDAQVVEHRPGWNPAAMSTALWCLAGLAWAGVFAGSVTPTLAVVLTAAAGLVRGRWRGDADAPVAYAPDLADALVGPAAPRFPKPRLLGRRPAPPAAAAVPPRPRGERLRASAEQALDAFVEALEGRTDLPAPFRDDGVQEVARLRAEARALAEQVDRAEREAAGPGASPADVERVIVQLERLRALRSAGEAVPEAEIAALERAVAQHRADEEAEAALGSYLATATAQLLAIASTASRLRRELAVVGRPLGSEALAALGRQVDAARRARHEAG